MNDTPRQPAMGPGEARAAAAILQRAGWPAGRCRVTALRADGSGRRFLRIHGPGNRAVAILPPDRSAAAMAEARSTWLLGRHLERCGVPVPAILGHDQDLGLVVCEDLGDERLHDLVERAREGSGWSRVRAVYQEVVEELAHMQVRAGQGLEPRWCWDTAVYDTALMLERESGYFLQALCQDLLGLDWDHGAVDQERGAIARAAAAADASFFLHRDFQSRNIMLHRGRVRFIDFQGGRRGPLAYDLASLLIDPYAALPGNLREHLVEHYLGTLGRLVPVEETAFRAHYHFLALQRGMQIAGAFATLGHLRGKAFFKPFLVPALDFLADALRPAFPALEDLTRAARAALEERGLTARPDRGT